MARRKNPSKAEPSRPAIARLLEIMARLRAPDGCPWDREQDHRSLRYHAVEEVYELLDAIEAGDDHEMEEELGDVLLQVVFHAQMADERGAFDFNDVAQRLVDKLVHRHPHVFGDAEARTAAAVWEQWDRLKQVEKAGAGKPRKSALDGIPRRLPALMRAQKLWKKAARAGLAQPETAETCEAGGRPLRGARLRDHVARRLFELARLCQEQGWSAEELLRQESRLRERTWRQAERRRDRAGKQGR
ncbi:MAG: nucleoside triphosphate pyrophosphohydrolase [Verrucomicrobiales bacterium]|nr:nucleoside triphosphate pyrophosphohydrolase [Verrucomicrobiales bacterium]